MHGVPAEQWDQHTALGEHPNLTQRHPTNRANLHVHALISNIANRTVTGQASVMGMTKPPIKTKKELESISSLLARPGTDTTLPPTNQEEVS